MSAEGVIEFLRRKTGPEGGVVGWPAFVDAVLYAPEVGYYRQDRVRVGKGPGTDFFTACSLRPVMAGLVLEAIRNLLPEALLGEYTFVELGVEPGGGLFRSFGGKLPFGAVEEIPFGKAFRPAKKMVIFANELLDAQPFHRLQVIEGKWREWGVKIPMAEGMALEEALLPELSEEVRDQLLPHLPEGMPEGWRLDLSLAAERLVAEIAGQPWEGLLLLADYGRTLQELLEACPEGTARAFSAHRVSGALLANPGQQDITCDVCWDRIEAVLRRCGFDAVETVRQEAFFIRNCIQAIEAIICRAPEAYDPERATLQQLLHPAHLGHRFQVLWARRRLQEG